SYLPNRLKEYKYSTSDNIISNCKFINERVYSSFAIRILTSWKENRATHGIINNTERNRITKCTFQGEYDWNTIEIAGPRTIHNIIDSNRIYGKSISNIDIDKGASDNRIIGNVISEGGLPERHRHRKDVRVTGIAVYGSNRNLLSENNTIKDNEILNFSNPQVENSRFLYSSGISIIYTKNTEVVNNRISNLYPNRNYGVGILLDQFNTNVKIRNNSIKKLYRGIYESLNSIQNERIQLENNNLT